MVRATKKIVKNEKKKNRKEYMQTVMQRKGKGKSGNNMDMQIKREQSLIMQNYH